MFDILGEDLDPNRDYGVYTSMKKRVKNLAHKLFFKTCKTIWYYQAGKSISHPFSIPLIPFPIKEMYVKYDIDQDLTLRLMKAETSLDNILFLCCQIENDPVIDKIRAEAEKYIFP